MMVFSELKRFMRCVGAAEYNSFSSSNSHSVTHKRRSVVGDVRGHQAIADYLLELDFCSWGFDDVVELYQLGFSPNHHAIIELEAHWSPEEDEEGGNILYEYASMLSDGLGDPGYFRFIDWARMWRCDGHICLDFHYRGHCGNDNPNGPSVYWVWENGNGDPLCSLGGVQ